MNEESHGGKADKGDSRHLEHLAFTYSVPTTHSQKMTTMMLMIMLIRPTIAITSLLTRAQATLELVQQKADLTNIPVIRFFLFFITLMTQSGVVLVLVVVMLVLVDGQYFWMRRGNRDSSETGD